MDTESLTVFVCVTGEGTHLADCLTALGLAGVSAPRIISGSTESSLLLNAALALSLIHI